MRLAGSIALASLLCAARSFAAEPVIVVSPAEVYQGGIAAITVSGRELAEVKAQRGGEEIAFARTDDGSYVALVGFDLDQRPGAIEIALSGRGAGGTAWMRRATIQLTAKDFPREAISVPEAYDRLDKATLKRIEKEQAALDRLWKTRTPVLLWEGAFAPPVPGAINSPFGLRRVVNGAPRAPHAGVDMKAPLGSEVAAANRGRVVLRDNFFFSGNSLVLDHGGGLYTMYFHLSEFRVDDGAQVRKGEIIALSGMTGRVTGPHLHWGARLNGARVDPLELLEIGGKREARGESAHQR